MKASRVERLTAALVGAARRILGREAPGDEASAPAGEEDPAAAGPYRTAASADGAEREGPLFVTAANVSGLRGDAESRGTRHFSHGTKVYVRHVFSGSRRVSVVGRRRHSMRWACVIVPIELLVNARVQPVHSPSLLKRLTEPLAPNRGAPWPEDGSFHRSSRAHAEAVAALINR